MEKQACDAAVLKTQAIESMPFMALEKLSG
jgi:hypothetical protein